MKINRYFIGTLLVISLCVVCVQCKSNGNDIAIPKPKGYFRILPYDTIYNQFSSGPISVFTNSEALVYEIKDKKITDGSIWFNIDYQRYNATVYCSVVRTDKSVLDKHLRNRLSRVVNNARTSLPKSVVFDNIDAGYTSEVFFYPPDNVVPLQFITTDSASFVFSGAVYLNGFINADSIAPVVENITDDVMYMLQNISIASPEEK